MFLPRCAFLEVRVGIDFRRERLGEVSARTAEFFRKSGLFNVAVSNCGTEGFDDGEQYIGKDLERGGNHLI
jgi:hypothetical protein